MKRWILIVANSLVLILGVCLAIWYSTRVRLERTNMTKDAFVSTVYSMEQVTMGYLTSEQGYVDNWKNYINGADMTIDDVLLLLRNMNADSEISIHIIDPETLLGRSTEPTDVDGSDDSVDYRYLNDDAKAEIEAIAETVGEDDSTEDLHVVSAFTNPVDGIIVVGFGGVISLKQEDGSKKDYILLRLIATSTLQEQWVFPTGYEDAEIGLISSDGYYVIRSNAMKSENFFEFIRAYNNMTYPQRDAVANRITNSGTGILEYMNSKKETSYWVYTPVSDSKKWYMIGYIPASSLGDNSNNWVLVAIVAGMLGLLFVINGLALLFVNRQLRDSMVAANQANEAKTRFLSTMSHDIRTPMNAVIGMTVIAQRSLDDRERVSDCLNKIAASGKHLLTLINDILDISKVESNNFSLNPIAFSLADTVDNLVNIIRPQTLKKQISFHMEFDRSKPVCLYADELRLNQIFINLLSNAVKYTPNGGAIHVTLAWEMLSASENVRLVYTVTDNGIGMSKEFIGNLYQPFTRETDGRISTVEGTGLGLSITKRLVDLMHGTITVESELQKGSTFEVTLELPLAKEAPAGLANDGTQSAEPTQDDDDFSGMHLLIAEDNDMNYEIIESLLTYQHITCDRAENGAICVEKINEAPDHYAAILMDVQMPVMNGREATKEIRASSNPHVANIPIIAMTADAFAEDIQACLDAGMNAHVAKPIDMKQLLTKLKQIKIYKNEREESAK